MCASCVELVTFDQMRQRYPQLEQHRIAPSGGAFCRAERLKGGGAAGTYAMPRPMAPTGEKHFFGFYLTQRRLLLAEDGEFLRGLADDLEAGTPAQALAELFTRLLQEDMPTLQKYEKRLTALEEDLMQDQAQDLDKKLFRIRRELSVFAAYYEQLDDLFAVLSEETEEAWSPTPGWRAAWRSPAPGICAACPPSGRDGSWSRTRRPVWPLWRPPPLRGTGCWTCAPHRGENPSPWPWTWATGGRSCPATFTPTR